MGTSVKLYLHGFSVIKLKRSDDDLFMAEERVILRTQKYASHVIWSVICSTFYLNILLNKKIDTLWLKLLSVLHFISPKRMDVILNMWK